MGAIDQQPQMFFEQIARLEKQNRMLKRIGFFLFFLCFSAIALIGWQVKRVSAATGSNVRANIISARQFNLVDEDGKMQGFLAAALGGAVLDLNGADGKSGLSFNPVPGDFGGSSLTLTSANQEQEIELTVGDTVSWLTVGGKKTGDRIHITAGDGDQSVVVSDKAGFKTVLGRASLVKPESGETANTSVAALTLFGKDGHVTWRTPSP